MYTEQSSILLSFSFYFLFCFFTCFSLTPGSAGTRRNAKGDGPQEKGKLVSQVHNDRKNRKRKRRPQGRKKPGRMKIYGSAYNQLRSDIGYIMSMINVETKYVDIAPTTTVLSGAWQLFLLNGISQGVTANTRNGQSVKASGLEMKVFTTINPAATTVQSYRFVVFVDHQPNATAPTATDVYLAGPVTFRSVPYLDRFTIIWEKWAILDPETLSAEVEQFSRRLGWHEEFNAASTGLIGDITKNSLYFMMYSDAGVNFPTAVWNCRYVFVDN